MPRLSRSDAFKAAFGKLDPTLQEQVVEALRALRAGPPYPRRLRYEKLRGFRHPSVYTIHVTRNHSHKISIEVNGDIAHLRKLGTHKEIDRAP